MENSKEMWMREALAEAGLAALRDEVPVAALLVCQGELLAVGSNTREQSQRTASHAEMIALEAYNARHRSWRLPPGTALYVTSEPCLMCAGALLQARVGAIYYGCDDPKNAGIRNLLKLIEDNRFDHQPSEIEGGILAAECASLLSGFFRHKRSEKALLAASTIH